MVAVKEDQNKNTMISNNMWGKATKSDITGRTNYSIYQNGNGIAAARILDQAGAGTND